MGKARFMTASQIKAKLDAVGSPFFSRKTMAFFGDRMSNFGTYIHDDGTLRMFRRKPVKHGLMGEWIFNGTLSKVNDAR